MLRLSYCLLLSCPALSHSYTCTDGSLTCAIAADQPAEESTPNLLQRALWKRGGKAASKQPTAWIRTWLTAAAQGLASGTAAAEPPCPIQEAGGLEHLPMPAASQLEIPFFRRLGLLALGPACRQVLPAVVLGVGKHERACFLLLISWGVIAAGMVMWSFVSVLLVPRKDAEGRPVQRPRVLVDEEKAWSSGFLHWANLSWADTLVGSLGKCADATADDADVIRERCSSDYEPHKSFRRAWDEQIQRSGAERASLAWALVRVVGWKGCIFLVSAVVVEIGMSMVGMLLALDMLLHYLQASVAGGPHDLLEPTVLVIILVFCVPVVTRVASSIVTLLDGHYSNHCAAGLAAAVYEKALLVPACGTLQGEGRPNIVTLLSGDIIEAWGYLLKTLVYTAVAPLAAIGLLALLAVKLRFAGMLGSVYIAPALLVTWFIQTCNTSSWRRYQGHQDARLAQLAEAVMNIRAVKALAWEGLFQRKIEAARGRELKASFACTMTAGCAQANLHAIPWLSLALTILCAGLMHQGVEAYHLFVIQRIMASLLSLLQTTALGLQKLAAAHSSLARIKAFLLQQERPRSIAKQPPLQQNAPAVRLSGSFSFGPGFRPVLQNLDLAIPRGELVAVMGTVASGKSALLLSMVGELFPSSARPLLEVPAVLSYCAQSPWIFEGTLRENITMSQVFEEKRYHRALQAAALMPDIQLLPGGDQATIGSHGIRLSSGQRARVALARVAYMEQAELVLLDEPLAALDSSTAQHVFDRLVCGPLLSGRTRIVAGDMDTARLARFDRIILLEAGQVVASGPRAEVMESEAFKRLQCPHGDPAPAPVQSEEVPEKIAVAGSLPPRLPLLAAPADLEGRERLSWSAMRIWLQACGTGRLLLFVVLVALQRAAFLAESFVLALWVDAKALGAPRHENYLLLLVVVVCACCLCFLMAYWAAGSASLSASQELHSNVLQGLLRAPLDRFYDRQPLGRLMSRLSLDLRQLDSAVAQCVLMLLAFCCGFVLTQGYILSTLPQTLAFGVLPIYGLLFYLLYLYRGTAVPLVFRSKLSLSAVQEMQSTVLGTCVSIRANGMRQEFMAKHNHFSASVVRCQYLAFHVVKAWVQARATLCYSALATLFALCGLWTQMHIGTLANVISLSFMAMSEFDAISLLFSSFVSVLNAVQRVARLMDLPSEAPAELAKDPEIRFNVTIEKGQLSHLELQEGGSEGVLLLTKAGFPFLRASDDGLTLQLAEGRCLRELAPSSYEALDVREPYDLVAVNGVSGSAAKMAEELVGAVSGSVWLDFWQTSFAKGMRLQIEDVVAGYRGEPSVLRGLSLDVAARGKVGLAGRSSCGKTTALLSILRLVEPRAGRIAIGGLDTSRLGLSALRTLVGFVPQEATVFAGSWRFNLDPYGEFPEGWLWERLRLVGLMPYLRTLQEGLDAEIAPGGVDISFGQKQLLGLARMAVRQPPVLLLDTCPSSAEGEEQFREAVGAQFPLSTVLLVVRRPEMLQVLDRVVVIDDGVVVEKSGAQEAMEAETGILPAILQGQ